MSSVAGHRGISVDVIVAGDFNAHSPVWNNVRRYQARGKSVRALYFLGAGSCQNR